MCRSRHRLTESQPHRFNDIKRKQNLNLIRTVEVGGVTEKHWIGAMTRLSAPPSPIQRLDDIVGSSKDLYLAHLIDQPLFSSPVLVSDLLSNPWSSSLSSNSSRAPSSTSLRIANAQLFIESVVPIRLSYPFTPTNSQIPRCASS